MSTIGQRIASWFWRDLQLRAGFREVTDQIPDSAALITYWATRVDEEIGDNRFIAALEKIANDPANSVTYFEDKWQMIARRALGPAKLEQAAKLGVTQFAADGDAHRVEQLTLPTSTPQEPAAERPAGGPIPPTGPDVSPDEFL